MKITAMIYKEGTGFEPEKDDLERANCKDAGKAGHYQCGWNHKLNLPYTMTNRGRKEE